MIYENERIIFSNTKIKIEFNGQYCDSWRAESGVRQGGVALAYHFCLYVDDMLMEIDEIWLIAEHY